MKLRIRGNSLRLRLARTESADLARLGFVEDRVQLGAKSDCTLVYRLELSSEVTKPTAVFPGAQICVRLPLAAGREWARNKSVGLYSEESWGLKLSIEKDFKCHGVRPEEDDSDGFENL